MRETIIFILIISICSLSLYAYSPDTRDIRQARSMYKRIAFGSNRIRPAQYIASGLAASMSAVLTYLFWTFFYMSTGGYSSRAKPPTIGLCCIMSNIVVLIPAYWQFMPKKCKNNNYLRQKYNNGFLIGIILNIALYILSFITLMENQD